MTLSGGQHLPTTGTPAGTLPRNVVVLGIVSLLMGMSSAMVYGVLPVFLVTVLGTGVASIGAIEGIAEATTSFMKILSGYASDRLGRRQPLVLLGYFLSAASKLLFPLAGSVTTVLVARIADRIGKGSRDAPRDALLTDITPWHVRGTGFGLRLALYTVGAVIGPSSAIALMKLSGDDFRLVVALIPAVASILVLALGVTEPTDPPDQARHRPAIR
jgi:sugar phosphate permease